MKGIAMETELPAQNVGEDYNPTTCEEKLKESKETQPSCPQLHCEAFQTTETYHNNCAHTYLYAPVQTMGCYNTITGKWEFTPPEELGQRCGELMAKEKGWIFKNCYCCCACFANSTLIGLPDDGQRQIAEIAEGDTIMAGTVNGGSVMWAPATVGFSQGTTEGEEPAMVFLVYGDGQQMVASTDQPLMLDDGSLTTASRVVPGRDRLMGADGTPLDVTRASIGTYTGGVHHIATNKPWTGSVNDHLIQANGVVAGDFELQLHFGEISQSQKVTGWASMPEVGTPEYAETHSHLETLGDPYSYGVTPSDLEIDSTTFSVYGTQSDLPLGTQSFVTPVQAEDILNNGQQAPITNRSGYAYAQQAIALVSGFYRDYVYYVDWSRNEPNVYAFEQYGQKVILVCGGLTRMKGIGFTGLAMAIAQSVARFVGGEPEAGEGYSCTGEADFYAFGVISQQIWFGTPWLQQSLAAIEQLTPLFNLISPENAAGNPLNVCEEPSIECRLNTWMTALAGGSLPECAGGQPRPPMTVRTVKAEGDSKVQIVFSQAPVKAEAESVSAYKLAPSGTIVSATVDAKENFIVDLQVSELTPGTYTLSCAGLKSIYGTKLDPDPTLALFEVEKSEVGMLS